MAGTPLTDSIEALTAYANQTTGASDTNLSDAVYTLVQGYGGGGGGESPFEIEEVVVGENTVRTMVEAHDYFFNNWALGNFLLLKETPDTYNQLVCMMDFNTVSSGTSGRYRNGTIAYANNATAYDGVIVHGTTYYKIYLK